MGFQIKDSAEWDCNWGKAKNLSDKDPQETAISSSGIIHMPWPMPRKMGQSGCCVWQAHGVATYFDTSIPACRGFMKENFYMCHSYNFL